MDLGGGIAAATSILTVGLLITTAILAWRDKRVRDIESRLDKSLKREKRWKAREVLRRHSMYALYEWVYWAERNLTLTAAATPAPPIPERPKFPDIEGEEDDAELEEEENGNGGV